MTLAGLLVAEVQARRTFAVARGAGEEVPPNCFSDSRPDEQCATSAIHPLKQLGWRACLKNQEALRN